MTTYHTLDLADFLKVKPANAHYINLPNGRILCAVREADEVFLKLPSISNLPHPIYDGTQELSEYHKKELAHLGLSNPTTRDVAKKLASIHPLMGIV
jgi:hypothetical protein